MVSAGMVIEKNRLIDCNDGFVKPQRYYKKEAALDLVHLSS